MLTLKTSTSMTVLVLYVDDIVLTTSTTTSLQKLLYLLKIESAMTDLGSLNYFLGILVIKNLEGIFLD